VVDAISTSRLFKANELELNLLELDTPPDVDFLRTPPGYEIDPVLVHLVSNAQYERFSLLFVACFFFFFLLTRRVSFF
jgi:hypothetical protein